MTIFAELFDQRDMAGRVQGLIMSHENRLAYKDVFDEASARIDMINRLVARLSYSHRVPGYLRHKVNEIKAWYPEEFSHAHNPSTRPGRAFLQGQPTAPAFLEKGEYDHAI